jgi:hypothetical protein
MDRLILVRATILSETTLAMADDLAAVSGQEVAFILDGRNPVTMATSRPIIKLTADACSALGLYCPPDFAWRCGDYGIYLARQQFPGATHLWLLEYDIRIAGGRVAAFFETFERRPEIDFLACNYRRASPDWDWYFNASGRDVLTFRCTFGIIRLSASAIDGLLAKRVQQAKISLRRRLCPNDEGFVATTLSNGEFSCADFNDFGRVFYNDNTMSLHIPVRGETFAPNMPGPMIHHPILWGADYERGNASRAEKPKLGRVMALKKWTLQRLNSISKW